MIRNIGLVRFIYDSETKTSGLYYDEDLDVYYCSGILGVARYTFYDNKDQKHTRYVFRSPTREENYHESGRPSLETIALFFPDEKPSSVEVILLTDYHPDFSNRTPGQTGKTGLKIIGTYTQERVLS